MRAQAFVQKPRSNEAKRDGSTKYPANFWHAVLEHSVWDRAVGGSNPSTQTMEEESVGDGARLESGARHLRREVRVLRFPLADCCLPSNVPTSLWQSGTKKTVSQNGSRITEVVSLVATQCVPALGMVFESPDFRNGLALLTLTGAFMWVWLGVPALSLAGLPLRVPIRAWCLDCASVRLRLDLCSRCCMENGRARDWLGLALFAAGVVVFARA
jgi:hypothetical protein